MDTAPAKSSETIPTQDAVQYAMEHPVDPRTYSRPGQERVHHFNPHVGSAQLRQSQLGGAHWDEVNFYISVYIVSGEH